MTDESKIDITNVLADVEIEPFDADELEGAAVLDAFVIFRYQRPDWEHPRTAYTSTSSMTSESEIGLLTMVSDQLRHQNLRGWTDD